MIVVSMAVIASRAGNVARILTNLERQTYPPDKVLLYYSPTPWHHDEGISHLEIPKTRLDVETVKVPNRGSCRKYLFSAERYRYTDASILLLDDDLIFDHRLIEILHDHQNEYRRVVGTRGWSQFEIVKDENGEKIFRRPKATATIIGDEIFKPTEVIVTSSGWATMFYAKDIDERMFNKELQESVQLRYSDEVFLAAMLPMSKFIIPMPHSFRRRLPVQKVLKNAPETPRAKALQAELLGAKVIARAETCLI